MKIILYINMILVIIGGLFFIAMNSMSFVYPKFVNVFYIVGMLSFLLSIVINPHTHKFIQGLIAELKETGK